MATIDGLTKARLLQLEADTVIGAHLTGDNLILEQHDGSEINVGSVRGPQGTPGISDMDLYDPIGVPKPLLIPTVPGGYGVCDGTTEYDAVDAPVLATAYGTGGACVNGASAVGKLRLPDMRGRVFVGQFPGVALFDTLLEKGGSRDAVVVSHTHTADQPAHNHTADQAGHDHGTTTASGFHYHLASVGNVLSSGDTSHAHTGNTGMTSEGHTGGALADPVPVNVDSDGSHQHNTSTADPGISVGNADPAISISTDGVSGTDKNVQPYIVGTWIMRLA